MLFLLLSTITSILFSQFLFPFRIKKCKCDNCFQKKRSIWCGELSPGKHTSYWQNSLKTTVRISPRFYSTQHCLLAMTEKWWKYLYKDGVNRALLTDLSKAFDCLLYDLLIAKLAADGFDYESLKLIQSYLSNRKQRTKANNTHSTFSDIIFGVPQGSLLGLLLFNIYICDMFYDNTDCDIALLQ